MSERTDTPIVKKISIKAHEYPAKTFVVSNNTPIDQLIRLEFMLSDETEYRLLENGDAVSLDVLLHPGQPHHDGIPEYSIEFDRSSIRRVDYEMHTVVLSAPLKTAATSALGSKSNAATLFNPITEADKIVPMCSTLYVNLPTRVQLRRLPDPDRECYVLDLHVDANYGLVHPINGSVLGAWVGNCFRLKMREVAGLDSERPRLHSISSSPKTETIEVPAITRDPASAARTRTMNCAYNPVAYRHVEKPVLSSAENIVAGTPASAENKTEKEKKEADKEYVWNKSPKTTKQLIKGFKEWIVEPKGLKDIMPKMETTFSQSFQLELDPNQNYPDVWKYEFEVVGEMQAVFTMDLPMADDVFEVVQNKPVVLNPGRKRIAAVQVCHICVDVYPQLMSLKCYKKGDWSPFVLNSSIHGRTAASQALENYTQVYDAVLSASGGQIRNDAEAEAAMQAHEAEMIQDFGRGMLAAEQAQRERDALAESQAAQLAQVTSPSLQEEESEKGRHRFTRAISSALNLDGKKSKGKSPERQQMTESTASGMASD